MNTWLYQYLDTEFMYYLAELHPEDGVLSESFFKTLPELRKFVKHNNIPIIFQDDVKVSKIDNAHEHYLGQIKMGQVNIAFYGGDKIMYKSQYQLSIESVKNTSEEHLGFMLKQMVEEMENHIKKNQDGVKE